MIDEFQRLPEDFADLLHFTSERKAKLILPGSGMRVVKSMLSARSPVARSVLRRKRHGCCKSGHDNRESLVREKYFLGKTEN